MNKLKILRSCNAFGDTERKPSSVRLVELSSKLLNHCRVTDFVFSHFFRCQKVPKYLSQTQRTSTENYFLRVTIRICRGSKSPQSPERTNLASVFGQFLTHDIALTWDGGKKPNCSKPAETECFEIPVSSDDPVFVNSIPMNRAARCKVGNRKQEEQVNTATSFIDASHIYGNNKEEEMKLRDFNFFGRSPPYNLPPSTCQELVTAIAN